jgi:hypothetical protein
MKARRMKKAVPGIGYGWKRLDTMLFSPSLRRHYPDQVPRVVPDQDSQPHGSPGYVNSTIQQNPS